MPPRRRLLSNTLLLALLSDLIPFIQNLETIQYNNLVAFIKSKVSNPTEQTAILTVLSGIQSSVQGLEAAV